MIRTQPQLMLEERYEAKLLARKNGPATSKEAAKKILQSGKLEKQEQTVYKAIVLYEERTRFLRPYKKGFTAKDLHNWTNLDYFVIQRRLSGLYRKGKIERTGEKRDGCCVWRLIWARQKGT